MLTFKEWRQLKEMTSFSVSQPFPYQGKDVHAVDMRFEDYFKKLSQYSPFVADIPDSNKAIVYDGGSAKIYDKVPDGWIDFAQLIGSDGTEIKPPKVTRDTERF